MKRKGFTLVELLVVVGIIALLVAMLMPALRKARTQALSIQCQSNLRQIGAALYNYATDWHDYIPGHGYAFVTIDGTRGGTFYHVLGKAKYLGSMENFRGTLFGFAQTRFAVERCPAETGASQYGMNSSTFFDAETMGGSYVMNLSVVKFGASYLGGATPAEKCYRKGFLKGPETMRSRAARIVVDTPDWGAFWVLAFYDWGIDNPFGPAYLPETGYAYRHPGRKLNALYMDGHVEPHANWSRTGEYVYQDLWLRPP